MNKAFLFVVLAIFATLPGCSKTDEPTPDETCRVTELTLGTLRWSFEYDEQGRVEVATSGNGRNTYRFNYLADSIEIKSYDLDGQVMDYVFYLDEKGRITNGYDKMNYGMDTRYVYNAEGYMISEFSNNQSVRLSMEYNDGNLIYWESKSSYDRDVNYIYYDTNESNYPYSSIVVYLYGPTFLVNLHKSVLLEAGYFGKKVTNFPVHATSERFTLKKDSKGKVIQVNTRVLGSQNEVSPYLFTYQCD